MKYTFFRLRAIILFLSMMLGMHLNAQEAYTNCFNPYMISNPSNWCSGDGFFSTIGVSNSNYDPATCWDNGNADIWISFIAQATAVNIVIDGQFPANTLNAPQVALMEGECVSPITEYECGADNLNQGVISIFQGGLAVGETYFIRVNGRNNNQGTFGLCINNYNPPVEPGQDCISGSILCDKNSFVVQSVTGAGDNQDEGAGTCLGPGGLNSEQQSTWFQWTAANNGTLTFTISPLQPSDDLDFAVFEINDISDCTNKEVLRCVATSCSGPTGLDLESTDTEEDWNCEPNEDGFVQYIDMVAGQSYALMINNFSNTGIGFNMDFGGTGEFLGPTADFTIDPPEGLACDQEFVLTDNSSDDVVEWYWNFGERAVPQTATGPGPHIVSYEKWGQKYVTLEVTSSEGCKITRIIDLFADACCEDLEAINIGLDSIVDLTCRGIPSGLIDVNGSGGTPEYEYSINDGIFTPQEIFSNLNAGTYKLKISDIKGCMDSIDVLVNQPDTFYVDAGVDQEVDLGYGTDITATVWPSGKITDITWSPDTLMDCSTCFSTFVIPPGATTYTAEVIDDNGCIARDTVRLRVNDKRPIYGPNIFSPNNDGFNEFFTIFGNNAATRMESLQVFDRWGNMIFEGVDLELGEPAVGWNGMFNGVPVNTGVYVWMAQILFVDNKVINYSGTVTVVR